MTPGADIDEPSICWQCGAPADPDCIYKRRLSVTNRWRADGHGFPVTRGWQSDSVCIPIPRCPRCQVRNFVVAWAIGSATMLGAVIGGTQFPSRGWTTIVGALGVLIPLSLAYKLYERLAGLRPIDSYPPVRRLIKEGWSDPV